MKHLLAKGCLASCLLFIFIPKVFAAVSCSTIKAPAMTLIDVPLDSANNILASVTSDYGYWSCNFSGTTVADRSIRLITLVPDQVKNTLLNAGVELYMRGSAIQTNTINLTSVPTGTEVHVGSWSVGNNTPIIQNYVYTLRKGSKPLQSFDTGEFTSGFHVGGTNNVLMSPFLQIKIKGEKINLCPDPSVSMDNKTVDFNALDAKDFIGGSTVKDSFNLRVNVAPTCQTGLNISVTFNSNNGTVVNQKYLLLDNGLQAVITDNDLKQEIHFGVPYKKGNITTQKPGNYNYNVELSRDNSQSLKAGEFSKTVNVLFTYQ